MMATTANGRCPMGRKGIGKLSSFSIANVVTVYTTSAGERTAFCMDAQRIREQMCDDDHGICPIEELDDDWPDALDEGTRIVLTHLKHEATQQTTHGLRQRIARRFSVIGPQHDFAVEVNGECISPHDRGYDRHVEYCWTYGDDTRVLERFGNLADNLNRLAVFMRGKVAQEDMLGDFGLKEIFADYVVGEIHCDDLDQDDDVDIATSSRQALKYDDPRFAAVRKFVHSELRHIAARWTDLRNQQGVKVFCEDVPAVAKWLDALQGDTKKKAARWIGRLNVLPAGDETKRELLKASILAFESYRWKEQLGFLGDVSNENIETILNVFREIGDLERSYYGQIAKSRLRVVEMLEEKLNADEKEHAIRDHIYENLWLLDPSWDIVEGSQASERTITKHLQKTSADLSEEERRARIDIGYRTAGGTHVIIELKRSSVRTPLARLFDQVLKYRKVALKHIPGTGHSSWPLDIVCLMGQGPPEWDTDPKVVRETLAPLHARLVFYDELLGNSRRAYAEYLEQRRKIDRLSGIFDAIDDFAAEQVD